MATAIATAIWASIRSWADIRGTVPIRGRKCGWTKSWAGKQRVTLQKRPSILPQWERSGTMENRRRNEEKERRRNHPGGYTRGSIPASPERDQPMKARTNTRRCWGGGRDGEQGEMGRLGWMVDCRQTSMLDPWNTARTKANSSVLLHQFKKKTAPYKEPQKDFCFADGHIWGRSNHFEGHNA